MTGLQIKICDGQEKTEYGKNIAMAVLFMTGWANIYGIAFSTLASYWWFLAVSGSFCAIGLLLLYETKFQTKISVAGIGITILVFRINLGMFQEGMLCLINDVLDFLTQKTGKIYLNYPVQKEEYAYVSAVGMFLLLSVWMAKAIKYRDKVILIIVWIFMCGALISGFAKVTIGFLLVVLATAVFLLPYGVGNKLRLVPAVFTVVLGGAVSVGSLWINKEYSAEQELENIKKELHKWHYESVQGAMPEGNLSNLSALERKSTVRLEVQMEKPQKMYLRGMVGEVYTGTGWTQPEERVYLEAEDIFYWLHKEGFYGQNSIGNAMLLMEDASELKMTVQNVGACRKYQYLPYALAGNEILDANAIGDGSVRARETMTEISYFAGSLPEWYQTKINLVNCDKEEKTDKYFKQEQTYKNFVYQQDLQITNSVAGVCQSVLEREQDTGTLGEIITTIREVLQAELNYNEQAVTLNGANDFFKYTMEQSKEGYSVHYATAAVLMLRYCGVPARYVEGYVISEEEASKFKAEESILVTDENAHAWAEYYLDGIGWIPFEVTPGYVDEGENEAVYNLLAGKGSAESKEQTYTKSNLQYQPALEQNQNDNSRGKEVQFVWNWNVLVKIMLLILLIAMLVLTARIEIRRRYLNKTIKEIKQADNRKAITMYYKYAKNLKSYADLTVLQAQEQIEQLNKEALFSNHIMTKEQRQIMEDYVKEVIRECKESQSAGKRFWYHYILWLYR